MSLTADINKKGTTKGCAFFCFFYRNYRYYRNYIDYRGYTNYFAVVLVDLTS